MLPPVPGFSSFQNMFLRYAGTTSLKSTATPSLMLRVRLEGRWGANALILGVNRARMVTSAVTRSWAIA
jgi:hypothetical protein